MNTLRPSGMRVYYPPCIVPAFSQGTCYILACNLEWRPIPLIINLFTFFTFHCVFYGLLAQKYDKKSFLQAKRQKTLIFLCFTLSKWTFCQTTSTISIIDFDVVNHNRPYYLYCDVALQTHFHSLFGSVVALQMHFHSLLESRCSVTNAFPQSVCVRCSVTNAFPQSVRVPL